MSKYVRKLPLKADCPVEKSLNIISGKWKLALLYDINRGTSRLIDLQKHNPEASKRALTQQLGELVEDGILQKKEYDVFPKRTEYSLTDLGKELFKAVKVLGEFGEKL